jgi:hypothetical protein
MSHRLLGIGCTLIVVGAMCAVGAFVSGSLRWMILIPLALLLLMLASPLFSFPKRTITPQQLADELERHLLGTEGGRDWGDLVTSRAIGNPKLDDLRSKLTKFDSLTLEERRKEFEEIIAALRRGEIPDVKPE